MKPSDMLQTASDSMLRSKLRTILTIIAIFIGAMTITLTNGIGTGIKSYLSKQIGNLGATNVLQINLTDSTSGPASSNSGPQLYNSNQRIATTSDRGRDSQELLMSEKDVKIIQSIPNITSAVPQRNLSPDYIMGSGSKYQLSLEQQFGITTADMLAGHGVSNSSNENQIIIPETYVSALGYGSNEDSMGKTVTIAITSALGQQSTVTATIVGVQQKAIIGDSTSYANTTLANRLYELQSNGLPTATTGLFPGVEATFPSNFSTSQINNIKNELKAKGYTGQTIKDRENSIFTAINVIIIVFDMFGAIALLAASFGIVNTLFMSVQERTKQIGLMKALGMSPKRIFMLFSIEAVLIGFWGSALGVGFAALIGNLINAVGRHGFLKDFPGLSLLTFPLSTIASVILGIMLIAFLAGTLPALKASRKDPIEALRYE